MKKAIIIHGWESSPEEHWYKEEKVLLEETGFKVVLPKMPNADFPVLGEWLKVLDAFEPDTESVLIGHSLGAPAILRFLEKTKVKVGKVFLIAGFARDLGFDATRNFVDQPFDWAKIKENAEEFFVINQKDDPWVPLECGKDIAESLGVELTIVDGNNHFDQMDLGLINGELEK